MSANINAKFQSKTKPIRNQSVSSSVNFHPQQCSTPPEFIRGSRNSNVNLVYKTQQFNRDLVGQSEQSAHNQLASTYYQSSSKHHQQKQNIIAKLNNWETVLSKERNQQKNDQETSGQPNTVQTFQSLPSAATSPKKQRGQIRPISAKTKISPSINASMGRNFTRNTLALSATKDQYL